MRIELTNGYFIERDDMNHTLKKRCKAKNKKTGEEYMADRPCGYWNTSSSGLEGAIEKFLRLNQIDCMADMSVEMNEYVNLVKQINFDAVCAIKRAIECALEDDGK